MLKQKLLKSAIFLALLISLTSCYTQFGLAKVEPTEEVYGYEGEPVEEEFYENDVVVRHVYINRYYNPGDFYFDPYDEWYFEPGFHFSFGYYYGPVYYTPVYYSYPYYVSPRYYCVTPLYYPPYWHPVYYPIHHPVPYYGGGSYVGHSYGYAQTVVKRRDFSRRSDRAIASKTTINRRGNQQTVRRTVSAGDGNSGLGYNRRISSSKRKNNSPDPGDNTYKRQEVKRRSTSSNSGNDPNITKPIKRNESKREYGTKQSNSLNTGSGYRITPAKTKKPSSSVSSQPRRVQVSRSSSRASTVSRSTSSVNRRSSSTPRITRSSSVSRSSSPARATSSGSSRSSGSSKSSSSSSKPRRR